MTDEERKKLCEKLRSGSIRWLMKAADEIERLAADVEHWKMIANRAYIDPKPLTQSEPVICPNCGVSVWQNAARPDASAGLIEAAEQARDLLNGRHNVGSDAYKAFCILNAAISRARAADRGG